METTYTRATLKTIRLSDLESATPETQGELLDACMRDGFFYLDVDDDHCDLANAIAYLADLNTRLFDIAEAEKRCYPFQTTGRGGCCGYKAVGTEAGAFAKPDGFELWMLPYNELMIPNYSHPLYGPEVVRLEKGTIATHTAAYHRICLLILDELSKALGFTKQRSLINEHAAHLPSTSSMTFLKYPEQEEIKAEGGHVSHTDIGTLTLLHATLDGLQVFSPGREDDVDNDNDATTGVWQWVPPRAGCLVVNVGDSLRLLSGKRLKSSLHRVVPHANAVGQARYSFAYFLRPSETALLDLGDGRVCKSLDWHFKKLTVFQAPPEVQAGNQAVLLGTWRSRALQLGWAPGPVVQGCMLSYAYLAILPSPAFLSVIDCDSDCHSKLTAMQLETLPQELLQRIGGYCPGSVLVDFASTCRAIRSACHDTTFYKLVATALIQRQSHIIADPDSNTATNTQVQAIARRACDNAAVWARYIVALDRAGDTYDGPCPDATRPSDAQEKKLARDTMQFVPQLLATGNSSWPLTMSQLAFSFAFEICSAIKTVPTHTHLSFVNAQNAMLNDWKIEPERCLHSQHYPYLLLGFMMSTLRAKGLWSPLTSYAPSLPVSTSRPDSTETIELPLPCDRTPRGQEQWEQWLRNVNKKSTYSEMMEGWEWDGIVSFDSYLLTFSNFGRLAFTLTPRDEGASSLICGRGCEGDREFTLEGELSHADSSVSMTQDFGCSKVRLQGRAGPFRIVGFWSTEYDKEVLGFFWIWRTGPSK
ncbi:uncharacterized protein PG986_010224 [Apiospora aurea]|uniref:Fe2OG dioxygenase domain-containing protein n=1 Tax=Apiospora aurea TaxID=335848 RepID=A0ABR1Q9X5_9PEZI